MTVLVKQVSLGLFGVLGIIGHCLFLEAKDPPISPRLEYQALLKEYQSAGSSGKVLTDKERLEFVGQVYKRRDKIASKFVELAEKHPKDPVALDALLQANWQVNTTPWPVEIVGREDYYLRAFPILIRDHAASQKLGPACRRLAMGFRQEYEAFLRAVLAKSPIHANRGQACLSLGAFLANRLQRVELIKGDPTLAGDFENLFGKDYLQGLLRKEPLLALKEAESMLLQAVREYGDVKLAEGGTVGDLAKARLFEMRNLGVGANAPEIEGRDQDGALIKLGDYRGKVVLLDFWSEY